MMYAEIFNIQENQKTDGILNVFAFLSYCNMVVSVITGDLVNVYSVTRVYRHSVYTNMYVRGLLLLRAVCSDVRTVNMSHRNPFRMCECVTFSYLAVGLIFRCFRLHAIGWERIEDTLHTNASS